MKQDTEGLMLYGFFCVSLSLSVSLSFLFFLQSILVREIVRERYFFLCV